MSADSGLAMHVHHDVLSEYCWSLKERWDVIRREKPIAERKVRLRLLRLFKDLPPVLVGAGERYRVARERYRVARERYRGAWKHWEVEWGRWEAAKEHWESAEVRYREVLQKHRGALLRLHAEQCPDCPWDGTTIFPKEGLKCHT